MMRTKILLLAISACLLGATCATAAETKPNIVMIFVDDWAWYGTPVRMDDNMPNSQMPIVKMPNLEQMARDGMKFRNAYAGAPQCSPSRVCLQTGRSAPRNGFTVFMTPPKGDAIFDTKKEYAKFPVIPCTSDATIDKDAVTIPEAIKPLGYVSAHFGKWHMRGDPADEGYIAHDGDTSNKPGNENVPGDPKLMFSVTKRSIEFIETQAKADKPFYLQISHYAMHEGRDCLPETRAKYAKHPALQAYYKTQTKKLSLKNDPATWLGMAEDLDGRIGAILDKLNKLGIRDNTYVIVTADNGYRHSFFPDLTQPLHAAKWWVWQGGLRVPMIVTGPGIPGGSVCQDNVVNYDFLPTFVEWAGGNPSQLKDIDGVSLAGILRGEKSEPAFQKRYLYFHYPHYRTSMPHSAIVSGSQKLIHFYEAPDVPMLFDLTDEREVKNIAEQSPVVHQQLQAEMNRYFKEVGARIPKPNPNYDAAIYQKDKQYEIIRRWGPFQGERPLEADEKK